MLGAAAVAEKRQLEPKRKRGRTIMQRGQLQKMKEKPQAMKERSRTRKNALMNALMKMPRKMMNN